MVLGDYYGNATMKWFAPNDQNSLERFGINAKRFGFKCLMWVVRSQVVHIKQGINANGS